MKRKPVSLADLAKLMDTTPATVSRALRNEECISLATRERAAKLAAELGYLPDPEVTRLMAHIRSRREARFQSVLALLSDSDPGEALAEDPYTLRLISGATQRANELGYTVDIIRLREPGMSQARLEQILFTRSIRGVLIPPQVDLPHHIVLPQKEVALVAATAARSHLHLHRVFPDQLENMRLLLDKAASTGKQKIGLISTVEMEERQRHCPLAAYEWFMSTRTSARRIPPLMVGASSHSIRSWFEKYRPQVLVIPDTWALHEIRDLCGPAEQTGVVLFGNHRKGFAGIDELPEVIGSAALELLTSHVLRGDYGFPQHCKNVMIQGRFLPGRSLPRVK